MTRRNRRRRQKRVAAAVVASGLLLVPAALATTSGREFLPVAAAFNDPSGLPGPGDLLAAVRRAMAQPEDYGASGELPEADTLSPELIAALGGSSTGIGGFGTGAGPQASVPPGPLGIPGVMLDAYLRAEATLAQTNPGCGLHWSVLAAIGRIESSHARGGAVDAQGTTVRPILGPQLSGGPGIAAIRDSDGGAMDGDAVWDRAVGPMQFIPTTWAGFAADGDSDGRANPHNVYDATLAAGRYLCSGGGDLRNPVQLAQAIFRYNHSDAYVANVMSWASAYASGVTPIPSSPMPIDEPAGDQPPLAAPPPGTTEPPGPPQQPDGPGTTPGATTTPGGPSSTTPTTTPTCATTTPPTSTSTSTSTTTPTTPPPPTCQPDAPTSSETTSPPAPTSTQGQDSPSVPQSSTNEATGSTPPANSSMVPSSSGGQSSISSSTGLSSTTGSTSGSASGSASGTASGDAAQSSTTTTSMPPN